MSPVAIVVLAATLSAGKPDARDRGPDTLDVSGYPPEQQKRYQLFAVKCSKCHTLARPINANFDAAEWKIYAKRMIRRPNSGINEEHAQELFAFLKFYSTQRKGGT